MKIRQYWLVYDISDDKERTRVERCVSRYGQRLQKSVFHCVLDASRLRQLQGELEALACQSGAILLAALADPTQWASLGKAATALGVNRVFAWS